MKKISIIVMITVALLCSVILLSADDLRIIEDVFPEIEGQVMCVQQTCLSGITCYGFCFAISGAGGGIGYYTNEGIEEFEVHCPAENLGAVALAIGEETESIVVAVGSGSYSDGLYHYYPATEEFELINWYYAPRFVKRLDSGYYCSYGIPETGLGLIHSEDGETWSNIEVFNDMRIYDVEECMDGPLVVAAENSIYMQNGEEWEILDMNLRVNDLFFCWYNDNMALFAACGAGTDSDGVYRIHYSGGNLSQDYLVNWFLEPNRIWAYENHLVVGCRNGNGMYLVLPEHLGEYQQIAQDIDFCEVCCCNTYPISTPNFLFGTDNGIYLAYGLITESTEISLRPELSSICSPNPFNDVLNISYSLQYPASVSLNIYNIKGQQVRTISGRNTRSGRYSLNWDGRDDNKAALASGIYYYKLQLDNGAEAAGKCIMLK